MSLLKNAIKTDYKGVYQKTIKDNIHYIIRFTVDNKTKTKLVGTEADKMTPFLAYKIKLEQIAMLNLNNINIKQGIKHSQYEFLYLFEQFYNYRKPFLANNTNQNYKSHMSQYFEQKFKNVDIQTLTKNDLQKYINSLLEIKRPATVDKIKNTLNQFYKYLIDNGITSYNPASNLILPKYDNKRYFQLSKKDVKRLIDYIMNLKDPRTKAIYMFLLHGRRISEVLTLQINNINFSTGVYKLDSVDAKMKKTKFWELEPFQLEHISKYYNEIKSNHKQYLFENTNTKKPITYTTFYRQHDKLKKDLELDNFSLHYFRHLVGNLMINGGFNLEVIARVLGHASIVSTQRYSELKLDVAKKSYSKMIKEYI